MFVDCFDVGLQKLWLIVDLVHRKLVRTKEKGGKEFNVRGIQ